MPFESRPNEACVLTCVCVCACPNGDRRNEVCVCSRDLRNTRRHLVLQNCVFPVTPLFIVYVFFL